MLEIKKHVCVPCRYVKDFTLGNVDLPHRLENSAAFGHENIHMDKPGLLPSDSKGDGVNFGIAGIAAWTTDILKLFLERRFDFHESYTGNFTRI